MELIKIILGVPGKGKTKLIKKLYKKQGLKVKNVRLKKCKKKWFMGLPCD